MLVRNERSFEIIQRINRQKAPLEARKQELANELQAFLVSIAEQEEAIRAKLREINDEIAPLDKLMVEAAQAGAIKSENARRMLLEDLEKRVA